MIWGMIKVIGAVLLILLLLLLLLLVSILLVPVHYKGKLYKEQETLFVKAQASWLFHMVFAQIEYDNKGLHWNVRLLGISIKALGKLLNRLKEGRKTGRKQTKPQMQTAEHDSKQEETAAKSVAQALETPSTFTEQEERSVQEETVRRKPKKNWLAKGKDIFLKIIALPGKISDAVRKTALTLQKMCDKMKALHSFLKSDMFRDALSVILTECKEILLHVKPRRIKGYIRFGFEDPSLTGQVLGIVSLCYPRYHKTLQIYPYFDRQIFEGDCIIKGRVCMGRLAMIGLRLYRNQKIKTVVQHFTNQEE